MSNLYVYEIKHAKLKFLIGAMFLALVILIETITSNNYQYTPPVGTIPQDKLDEYFDLNWDEQDEVDAEWEAKIDAEWEAL